MEVEGLDAKWVACAQQATSATVPEGEGEVAVEVLGETLAPPAIPGEEDLRVPRRGERRQLQCGDESCRIRKAKPTGDDQLPVPVVTGDRAHADASGGPCMAGASRQGAHHGVHVCNGDRGCVASEQPGEDGAGPVAEGG